MQIIAGKVVLDFYNNTTLEKKAVLIRDLTKAISARHFISFREVDDFDELEKCTLGWCAIAPEDWDGLRISKAVEKIFKDIDQTSAARVTLEDWEVVDAFVR
jgi:uncharacterized protein YlxP (DUF503 family)